VARRCSSVKRPGRIRAAALLALASAVALGACSADEETVEGPVTVYVSLPLSGPAAPDGRDAADGARLALEQANGRAGDLEVEAKYLDGANPVSRWDPTAVGRNARRAAQDSSTAAYIGELDSQPTRTSMPITNDAGIAQISPGASGIDLTAPAEGYPDSPEVYRPSGEVTFARVVPSDAVQVRAIADWAAEMRVPHVTVSPGVPPFGALMSDEFARDASEVGVEVSQFPDIGGGPSKGQPNSLFAVGFGPGPGELSVGPNTYGVVGTLEPNRLPPGSFPADFRARIDRRPGPYAAYGYEAMRVALEAIGNADTKDGFRASVIDGILDSDHSDSVLGTYSITSEGDSSLCAVQRYRLVGRRVPGEAVCPSG
jgi:branched-chain amino acid transport system substrate-binding protein